MVSFMDYVDPSNKMLQCHLEMTIRGVKRPIGDSFFSWVRFVFDAFLLDF